VHTEQPELGKARDDADRKLCGVVPVGDVWLDLRVDEAAHRAAQLEF